MNPRILLFDVENSPNLGYTWAKYEQDVIAFVKHWYLLSFSAKWLGEKKIITRALPDYPSYKWDRKNDRELCIELRDLLSQADIIVAHNGDRHDIRKSYARFIFHGLDPLPKTKTFDTLKAARKIAEFPSNKLDDLGKYLGVGRKLVHTGFDLWDRCMQGDLTAWKLMKKYNEQDVRLLERVYLRLRPWSHSHPNVSIFTRKQNSCPFCQSEQRRTDRFYYTKTTESPVFQCLECGHYYHGKSERLAVKVY